METNEKLMTLLRLMDEPEAMTDEQLEELLADDEVRNAYNLMADCKKLYQKPQPVKVKWLQLGQRFRIAAVFLGAVLLCGLAWAVIPHIIQHRLLLPSFTERGKGMGRLSASTTCASTASLPSFLPTMARLSPSATKSRGR